jgi:hypothetical protein
LPATFSNLGRNPLLNEAVSVYNPQSDCAGRFGNGVIAHFQ